MRLNHPWALVGIMISSLAVIPSVSADTVEFLPSPLVNHPVLHPTEVRSASRWRASVGSWGENFAEETIRLRGYNEIYEVKTRGNQGIDRVAIKRGADGVIKDVRYVEVKTSRSPKPRLNHTQYGGMQMSRQHLAENLKKMRNSGDPNLKKLAVELTRYRKSSGVPIQSMGEVIHINTKTGLITGYSGDGRTVKYVESAERLLRQVQRRGSSAEVRGWSARSLNQWDQIRANSMPSYLGKNVAQQSEKAILSSSGKGVGAAQAAVLGQARRVLARKILQRSAGPVALVAALAFDAKELYDTEYSYQRGVISERQRNVRILTTVVGAGGAFVGASAGGVAGAWFGALGGPLAWITMPAGGFIGATIGGIGGYLGGSTVVGYGATAWYSSIDAAVRDKFERAWLAMKVPNS